MLVDGDLRQAREVSDELVIGRGEYFAGTTEEHEARRDLGCLHIEQQREARPEPGIAQRFAQLLERDLLRHVLRENHGVFRSHFAACAVERLCQDMVHPPRESLRQRAALVNARAIPALQKQCCQHAMLVFLGALGQPVERTRQ
jgi:hypothetical protein